MDIFEAASRKALRFETNRGMIMTEQLWDMTLTSKNGFDLDSIARGVNDQLKSVTTESFVQIKPDPRKHDFELKLEIVKHVIAVRIAEQEAAKTRAEKMQKRAKLMEALASKENEEIAGKSKDQILKELAALEEAA